MEHKIFNAEEYLYRKNEPLKNELATRDRILDSVKEFCEPLQDINYKESNEFRIEKNSEAISCAFQNLEEETKVMLRDLFRQQGADMDFVKDRLDAEKWKEVSEYRLESKNQAGNLNLMELLPPGYKIVFYPQKELANACAFRDPDKKLILYVGDMSAPVALPILLHEIGHVRDFQELDKAATDKFVTDSPYANEAEQLRKERAATGYALKFLRPLFKNSEILNKQQTMDFLKLYALNGYNDNIESILLDKGFFNQFSSKLASDFARDIEAELAGWEEMEFYHKEREKELEQEFEEWKKTPEYAAWKGRERNKNARNEFWNWKEERQLKTYFEGWKKEKFGIQMTRYGNYVTYEDWKKTDRNFTLDGYEEFYKWLIEYERKDQPQY